MEQTMRASDCEAKGGGSKDRKKVIRRRDPDAIARGGNEGDRENWWGWPSFGGLKGPRRERNRRCGQDEARLSNAVRSVEAGRSAAASCLTSPLLVHFCALRSAAVEVHGAHGLATWNEPGIRTRVNDFWASQKLEDACRSCWWDAFPPSKNIYGKVKHYSSAFLVLDSVESFLLFISFLFSFQRSSHAAGIIGIL